MAMLVSLAGEDACLDLVTWAPTTSARRNARGFDHAELLARAIAGALGIPARRTLRRRPGPPQTGRPAAVRRVGPRFDARRGRCAPNVLLVDDVATTGATLTAAAGALRRHGTARVVAVVAARTPVPGRPSPSRRGMARV
jgi:predicted amidophosphoribosyltransferase